MTDRDATERNYAVWRCAYDHFNLVLFGNKLPGCLITLQRRRRAYGFHDGSRFEGAGSKIKIDEIALNPSQFSTRSAREVLSTLVHEMVHQHQHHFGRPGKRGYHNRAWARCMIEVGLVPTDTGEPGGKATGRRVTHFIRDDGPFDRACAELVSNGFAIPYVELPPTANAGVGDRTEQIRRQKAASKSRYTCPTCHPLRHVWGKPDLHVVCGDCGTRFEIDPSVEVW